MFLSFAILLSLHHVTSYAVIACLCHFLVSRWCLKTVNKELYLIYHKCSNGDNPSPHNLEELRKFYSYYNTMLNSPQFTKVKQFEVFKRTRSFRPVSSEISCHVTVFAYVYKNVKMASQMKP